jgi:hypothetical protein
MQFLFGKSIFSYSAEALIMWVYLTILESADYAFF